MRYSFKFLYNLISPLLNSPCRYESGAIKGGGGKWAEMLKAKEGEYFWKKNQEYLKYIREAMKEGKTVHDLIEEHKQHLQALHKTQDWHAYDDDPTAKKPAQWTESVTNRYSTENIAKGHRYADYIKKEVESGTPIEDVIEEVKEKMDKEDKSDSNTK